MPPSRFRPLAAVVALVLAVLVAGPAAAAAPAPQATTDRPELQAVLDTVVDAGAPGVAAFVRDDTGTWDGAAGVAAAGTGRAMSPDLRFRVGSLTKSFVATVVLQLVEEGRLSLDDPVEALLPGVLPDGDEITVRHLLQHTSGVPDYAMEVLRDFWVDPRAPHRSWTPAEIVAIVADAPRLFPPGTDWSYSNTGYIVLGMVVEELTGQRLDRVLDERILRPLDLDDTWLPLQARGFGGPFARGTSVPVDTDFEVIGPPADATVYNPSMTYAAGALVSTAADLARFQAALLEGELLPPALLAEMRTTVSTGIPGEDYGLGLIEIALPCGTAVGHTGGVPGYTTYAFSSPDASTQVMLLLNTDALTEELLSAFTNAFAVSFCGDDLGAPGVAAEPTVPRPELRLAPQR